METKSSILRNSAKIEKYLTRKQNQATLLYME